MGKKKTPHNLALATLVGMFSLMLMVWFSVTLGTLHLLSFHNITLLMGIGIFIGTFLSSFIASLLLMELTKK